MFAKVALLAMVFVVAAEAETIKLLSCNTTNKATISLEKDKCTKSQTSGTNTTSYTKVSITTGSIKNKTAVGTYGIFSDDKCATQVTSFNVDCTCTGTDVYRLNCNFAATVLPSALLIIAAVMAHLF